MFQGIPRFVYLPHLWSEENFRDTELYGIRRWETGVDTEFKEQVQGGIEFEWGKMVARGLNPPVLGDGVNMEIWGTLRPVTRVVIEPVFDYATLDHPDDEPVRRLHRPRPQQLPVHGRAIPSARRAVR